MKLETITLNNFRQYYGEQYMEFAHDGEKNVTVVHGANGAGKTSFFLALNWCLYGEMDAKHGFTDKSQLVSKEALSRTADGNEVSCGVNLTFKHDGRRYIVSRSFDAEKLAGNLARVKTPDDFAMMAVGSDGQAAKVHNPIGTINSILPVNVREYFLFDGEKIDDFAKPESAPEVKKAIQLVLKLELLDRARRHLNDGADRLRKKLKQTASHDVEVLLEEEEKARKILDAAKKRIQEIATESEAASSHIAEIDARLSDLREAESLSKERGSLRVGQTRCERDRDAAAERIRRVATALYFPVVADTVKTAEGIVSAKRKRGEIPSNIKRQFVLDLLRNEECICGRGLKPNKDTPSRTRLEELLGRSYPGSLEDTVLNLGAALASLPSQTERLREDLKDATETRRRAITELDAIEKRLDDISRLLLDEGVETEIGGLESKRRRYEADRLKLAGEKGRTDSLVERAKRRIADLEKEQKEARKKKRDQYELGVRYELAQQSADAIGDIYEVFAEEMRDQIEKKTREIFAKLAWKGDHFADVRLGEGYDLEVIDKYGTPARPSLSAGERQVLSLSFITAMSRVSEEEAPLVMDTPFGRLSSDHREAITLNLPGLADQLVLFVTDEELHGKARENLDSRIGVEYELCFDKKTSCTTIVEV